MVGQLNHERLDWKKYNRQVERRKRKKCGLARVCFTMYVHCLKISIYDKMETFTYNNRFILILFEFTSKWLGIVSRQTKRVFRVISRTSRYIWEVIDEISRNVLPNPTLPIYDWSYPFYAFSYSWVGKVCIFSFLTLNFSTNIQSQVWVRSLHCLVSSSTLVSFMEKSGI